ncbi:MAG: endonuclease domain-containing protein [Gammaproteobacteria bacterium]|nr:endonuclease domain-containing protein [Gammaproteobacteria bacterium]MBU1724806.1 endonuclease domain-containing protein [Gammaproteobacteria bacterium]MBU2006531.1 endonuclease domain-containing protein [Gammaproteobacteria bacterium]
MKKDPTPTLPLPGEGARTPDSSLHSSPWQGGGREGVSSQAVGREGVNSSQEWVNSYTQPSSLNNHPQYKERRRELRSQPTSAEHRLWQYLRKNQLGVKFRRQHGIHHYIVDFYCPELALVIEVDGEIHTSEDTREYDQERDNLLKSCGLQVLRFTNHQVLNDTHTTLTQIQQAFSLPPPPGKGEAGRGSSSRKDSPNAQ